MFANLCSVTFDRSSFPVILRIESRIELQLMGHIVDDRLRNVMFGGRKASIILKAFEQERVAKPSGTSLIGESIQVVSNKGKVFNQFFNIPLAFHLHSSLHFYAKHQEQERKRNGSQLFACIYLYYSELEKETQSRSRNKDFSAASALSQEHVE